MNARDRDVARGRVQVLQSGRIVESVGFKRAELDKVIEHVSITSDVASRVHEVDQALDRAATALLDAIDELVVVDRELAKVTVPA